MSEQLQETPVEETPSEAVTTVTETTRVFKIGTTRIVENDTTLGKPAVDVQALLKPAYPEIANATIRERVEGDYTVVEFLPQPGRKG